MEIIKRILRAIGEECILYKIIQHGVKPIEIKNAIIELFNPYFENKQILEKFSIEILVPEMINLLRLQVDNWLFIIFEEYYEVFKEAKRVDKNKCFESFAYWHHEIIDANSRFWSIHNLELDKNNLPDSEMIFECFRNIGDIIEGLNKSYLKNLLCQLKIVNGTAQAFQDIGNIDLGEIVNQLIKLSKFQELFSPPPLKISINQWRNIAYHHDFKLVNDVIFLWYGKGKKRVELMIPKKDILQIAGTIFNCFKLQKLAYTLFFVDNIEAINKFLPNLDDSLRFESLFINIASGIASQGFEIINLEQNPGEAKLIVKDLTDLNSNERCIHASQFLYSLWLMTKAKKLIVEYRENDGVPKVLFKINSDICEQIYRGGIEFPDMGEKMDIITLKGSENELRRD